MKITSESWKNDEPFRNYKTNRQSDVHVLKDVTIVIYKEIKKDDKRGKNIDPNEIDRKPMYAKVIICLY